LADMRGLVVSSQITLEGTSVRIRQFNLDSQELRSNLLFWDRLSFPKTRLANFPMSDDEQYLIDTGVLERRQFETTRERITDPAAMFLEAHLKAFRELDREEPGAWSLATGERSLSFPETELTDGRGVLVKLHQAIPVPDKDVPLNEVLEFRERRRDELIGLRHHLERIYLRIVEAGDGDLALRTESEALERAIADHTKASREARFSLRLSGLSASLNLLGWTVASGALYTAGLPLVESVLGGAVPSLSVSIGAGLKGRQAIATPFKYVSSYNRELFP